MCYLYLNLKLRVFLKRKVQLKSVPKGVVFFIHSIDKKKSIELMHSIKKIGLNVESVKPNTYN